MKNVILAGICLNADRKRFVSKMQECRELCRACGYEPIAEIIQNSVSMDRNTAFRSGKLDELVHLVKETEADGIVFCNTLTVSASARIAEAAGVIVMDRTSLILDIFAARARTRQAKLQTEMARLQYALPSIKNVQEESERSRGGSVNNRGAGEMRSALIARSYRARISELKKELADIEKRRSQDERRRSKTLLKRVALVGYTNAGKSSLLNRILERYGGSGSKVMSEDMLFATLDTSVRLVQYKQYAFLLYDTVGFVSDMPESLLDAFYSTLSIAKEADLLVNVIDAHENYEEKTEVTEMTLKEIGAQDIPVLRVYNKIDLCAHPEMIMGNQISCYTGEGLDSFMDELIAHLYRKEEEYQVFLPYDKMSMFNEYQKVCSIEITEHQEEGMLLKVSGEKEYLQAFEQYRTNRNEENYVKNSLGKNQ